MSWKLITEKTKTKKLSASLAREFAGMTPAPHDRPLSERRLNVYRALVERGEFRPCTWACAHCKESNEMFRVNGKHTSTLFSQIENIPDTLVTVEFYECDSIEDVARLYATFDTVIASRSTSDINRAFSATVPELATLPARIINLAASGMSWFKWRTQYGNVPAAERAELLLDFVQFVLWINELLQAKPRVYKHLCRSAVAAAMFATWQKSQKDSTEFWTTVRDETGTSPAKPDRKLARYLSVMNVNNGCGGNAPRSRKADAKEFYVKCIHAWNAWRKQESTDLKYYPSAKVPDAK